MSAVHCVHCGTPGTLSPGNEHVVSREQTAGAATVMATTARARAGVDEGGQTWSPTTICW